VGEYTIRPFQTIEEYRGCVDLQEETWGLGFSERVSPAILKVAQKLGGVAAGAYDQGDRLVGFVFGMTGLRNGEVVHWSDMLAVRPEARDAGLGMRLKAYQRAEVLALGVETMFWTFDPLQSRNAYLNLTKLGAVVREYAVDMYGDTDSPLHHGIGTDRFIALWLMRSRRVEERLAGHATRRREGRSTGVALSSDTTGRWPRPGKPDLHLETDLVHVAIPSSIGAVMQDDLGVAIEWRAATRAAFQFYLSRGYEVRDFEKGEQTATYVLARTTDP
jgi:predicted GNAT superfamily acetyltransferase